MKNKITLPLFLACALGWTAPEPIKRYELVSRDGYYLEQTFVLEESQKRIVAENLLRLNENGEVANAEHPNTVHSLFQKYSTWNSPPEIVRKMLNYYASRGLTSAVYRRGSDLALRNGPALRQLASQPASSDNPIALLAKESLDKTPTVKACLTKVGHQTSTAPTTAHNGQYELFFQDKLIGIRVSPIRPAQNTEMDSALNHINERLLQQEPCIQRFFAEHGIVLSLIPPAAPRTLATTQPARTAAPCTVGIPENSQNQCQLALHDVGHLLGIADRFHEHALPVSVMTSSRFPMSAYRLSQGELKTILSPLCEGVL